MSLKNVSGHMNKAKDLMDDGDGFMMVRPGDARALGAPRATKTGRYAGRLGRAAYSEL